MSDDCRRETSHGEFRMKYQPPIAAVTTPGLLGTAMVVMITMGHMSPWWLFMAVPLLLIAFNIETQN